MPTFKLTDYEDETDFHLELLLEQFIENYTFNNPTKENFLSNPEYSHLFQKWLDFRRIFYYMVIASRQLKLNTKHKWPYLISFNAVRKIYHGFPSQIKSIVKYINLRPLVETFSHKNKYNYITTYPELFN